MEAALLISCFAECSLALWRYPPADVSASKLYGGHKKRLAGQEGLYVHCSYTGAYHTDVIFVHTKGTPLPSVLFSTPSGTVPEMRDSLKDLLNVIVSWVIGYLPRLLAALRFLRRARKLLQNIACRADGIDADGFEELQFTSFLQVFRLADVQAKDRFAAA